MNTDTSDRPGTGASWRDDVDRLRPTVLVLGGFLTAPFMYDRFAARLRARGAAGVVVSQVWLPDWLLATSRGLYAVTARAGRALKNAVAISAEYSAGAPLLVVGHSAGGIVARLLTAREPFPGRRFGAAPHIGAIVTLGTPHSVAIDGWIGARLQLVAASVADEAVPGAYWRPEVGYLSVASQAIVGDPGGSGQERVSYALYRSLLGSAVATGTRGDGLVPVASGLLSGARHLTLDTAVHGPGSRAPWYGADEQLDDWWPEALETWREALRCRATRLDPLAATAMLARESLREAG